MIVQRSKAQTDAQTIAILEARKSQIPHMEQMAEKAQEAINLVQTAEGVLQAVWEILQRIKELAMQAASDASTAEEFGLIREENSQLQYEVDRLVSGKEISRLKQYRTSEKEITLHFGESEEECITFPFEEFSTVALGVDASHVDLSAPEHASESMPYVDAALDKVARQRGVLDAVRNRLEQVKNLVKCI